MFLILSSNLSKKFHSFKTLEINNVQSVWKYTLILNFPSGINFHKISLTRINIGTYNNTKLKTYKNHNNKFKENIIIYVYILTFMLHSPITSYGTRTSLIFYFFIGWLCLLYYMKKTMINDKIIYNVFNNVSEELIYLSNAFII